MIRRSERAGSIRGIGSDLAWGAQAGTGSVGRPVRSCGAAAACRPDWACRTIGRPLTGPTGARPGARPIRQARPRGRSDERYPTRAVVATAAGWRVMRGRAAAAAPWRPSRAGSPRIRRRARPSAVNGGRSPARRAQPRLRPSGSPKLCGRPETLVRRERRIREAPDASPQAKGAGDPPTPCAVELNEWYHRPARTGDPQIHNLNILVLRKIPRFLTNIFRVLF